MKPARKYTGEALGRLKVVDDFLPPPDQLVLKDDEVDITISVTRSTVEFFKAHAERSRVPYQRMIRALLDSYADLNADQGPRRRASGRRTR